jgi:hemolysin activation/secretion protein
MSKTYNKNRILLALFFTLLSKNIFAGAPTDAGKVLRDTEIPAPTVPASPDIINAPPVQKQTLPNQDVKVPTSAFAFTGNSVFTNEQLQAVTADWAGKQLNFGELTQATDAVEAFYHQAGYFLAQATLPPQKISNGIINIVISEGVLGKTRLEGESRIAPEVLYGFLDRVPSGKALTRAQLERTALLISDLAGSRSTLDLQAGSELGTTDIVLLQREESLFSGRVELDNHGLPTTGEYRLGFLGNVSSPLHRGDFLSGNLLATNTGNLHAYGIRYDTPIGSDGLHVNASHTYARYSLGDDFSNLDARGSALSWRAGASYPVVRSLSKNIWLKVEGDYNRLNNEIGVANLDLDSTIKGIGFYPSIDWLDAFGGGGSNDIYVGLRVGHLNLDAQGRALDAPPLGLNTEGSFTKTNVRLQRIQTLSSKVLLQLQWLQQFASKNLDSSEQLSVGGSSNLVGYPNSQANFDEGGMGRAHVYWQALGNLRLGVFGEYATVKLANNPLPGTDNKHQYSDFGFSADWRINKEFYLASRLAWATGEQAIKSDDDKPRLWVNLNYTFGDSKTKLVNKNEIQATEIK